MPKTELNYVKSPKKFKDRTSEKSLFLATYNSLIGTTNEYQVIEYWGTGGIGKSRLIEELQNYLDENKSYHTKIDLSNANNFKTNILSQIVMQLFNTDAKTFPFLQFRSAIFALSKLTGEDLQIKEMGKDFINPEKISDILLSYGETFIEKYSKALSAFELTKKTFKMVKDATNLKKSTDNNILKELYKDQIRERTIYENLEYIFSSDLYMATSKLKKPLVIFLDTYEHFNKAYSMDESEKMVSEENWVKSIIKRSTNTLWVISSRDKLKWTDVEFIDKEINSLDIADAKEILTDANFPEDLIDIALANSHCKPVYLNLLLDRFDSIRSSNEYVANNYKIDYNRDFGTTFQELANKYLDDSMDDLAKTMAYFLSILKNWTDEEAMNVMNKSHFFDYILDKNKAYKSFLEHSFISVDENNRYYIQDIIQDTFYNSAKERAKDLVDDIKSILAATALTQIKEQKKAPNVNFIIENLKEKQETIETDSFTQQIELLMQEQKKYFDEQNISRGIELNKEITDLILTKDRKKYAFLVDKIPNNYLYLYEKEKQEIDPQNKEALDTLYNVYLNNVAVTYQYIDKFDESLKIRKEIYQKNCEIFGNKSPQAEKSQNNLNWTIISKKQIDDKNFELDYYCKHKYIGEIDKYNVQSGKGTIDYRNGDVYEGEFKNNRFNGYGILKAKGYFMEGNYVNDKLEGKGKYTSFHKGKISWQYEGDFKNNKFDGTGVLANKTILYEGPFKAGRICGKGLIYFHKFGYSYYINGIFVGDKANVEKIEIYEKKKDDLVFVSELDPKSFKRVIEIFLRQVNSIKHNKNQAYLDGSFYEGKFKNGLRHGYGVCTYIDGSKYEGNWEDDRYSGYGTFTNEYNTKFTGNYIYGVLNGKATVLYQSKTTYTGNFINGNRNGLGHITYASGSSYDGNWYKGQTHGQGKYIWSDNEYYEGSFSHGKRDGYGIYHYPDGSIYEGNWVKGKKQGHGKYINKTLEYTFEGEFDNDEEATGKYTSLRSDGAYGVIKTKVVNQNNQPVANIEITICNTTLTTGDDGCTFLYNVDLGEHEIKINNISDEYELISNDLTVTAKKDECTEKTIVLHRKNCLFEINIKDTFNRKISGVDFTFYDLNDNIVSKKTSDSNGNVSIIIPQGTYYYTVQEIPDIYEKENQKYEFTLQTKDEYLSTTLELEYKTIGTIIFNVKNKNGNPVSDVKIDLYKSDMTFIKTYTTNNEGITGTKGVRETSNKFIYSLSEVPDKYIITNDNINQKFEITNDSTTLNIILEDK